MAFAFMPLSPVTNLEDFARLVTGLSGMKAKAIFYGLEHVGKTKITEKRKVFCPLASYKKREEMEDWLMTYCQEEGWILNSYLGSRDSTSPAATSEGDGIYLHYSVVKYVD